MTSRTGQIVCAGALAALLGTAAPPALAQVAGGFGVGTTTPNAALHVFRDDGMAQVLVEETAASAARVLFKIVNNGPTRFQIVNTNGGGSELFNFALNNAGDFVIDEPGDAENPEFLFQENGNATFFGTLTELSDSRLKQAIAPLGNVLERIQGIRGVTYRWDGERGETLGAQIGLLAQDVQGAFPELVREGGQGHLSVAYGKFTAVLLEAIKEQQARIAELEAAVLRLEGRVGSN